MKPIKGITAGAKAGVEPPRSGSHESGWDKKIQRKRKGVKENHLALPETKAHVRNGRGNIKVKWGET